MPRALINRLFALVAAISLIVVGAISAHSMAPDRETVAIEATMLALGVTEEDFCLDGSLAHTHDCPLCHKLPDPLRVVAPDDFLAIDLPQGSVIAVPQEVIPLRQTSGILARAPPKVA